MPASALPTACSLSLLAAGCRAPLRPPTYSSSCSLGSLVTLCPTARALRPGTPSTIPLRKHARHACAWGMAGKESAANNPGLVEDVDPATSPYVMQQTMYRIKDPKASLKFYSEVLGMRLLKRLDFPEASFSLYFMGYENPEEIPSNEAERIKWTFSRRATIELTHNYGTESDPEFKGYHNGNTDPRGWGHIGVMVDDVYKACERFEKLGVDFVKKPDDGRMKGLAFIKDPDGYWIEIFDTTHMAKLLVP